VKPAEPPKEAPKAGGDELGDLEFNPGDIEMSGGLEQSVFKPPEPAQMSMAEQLAA